MKRLNIEVPRPYHLAINGKIYNLEWLEVVLYGLGALGAVGAFYVAYLMLWLAS